MPIDNVIYNTIKNIIKVNVVINTPDIAEYLSKCLSR